MRICLSLPEQSPDKHRAERRQGRYSSGRQGVLWSVASVFFSWKTEDIADEGLEQHIHFEGKFHCLRQSGKLFNSLTSSAVHNTLEESQIYKYTLRKS